MSLSIGAPLGNLGWIRLLGSLRDIEEGLQKVSIPLCRSSARGTQGEGSFAGDLEGHGEEGSGDRHHSPWGPSWGAWKGARLPGICVCSRDGALSP